MTIDEVTLLEGYSIANTITVPMLYMCSLDDVVLAVFLSPVGDRALLGVLLLGGSAALVFGEPCLTSVCLRGSVLTTPALVGVVSLDDLLLPLLPAAGRVLVTVLVLRLVMTVCFLPLGSVIVSFSVPVPVSWPVSAAFFVEMAV